MNKNKPGRPKGSKMSEEAKAQMMEVKRRYGIGMKRVSIRGIEFASGVDAAKHFNRTPQTIWSWLQNEKYTDCFYVDSND